MKILVILISMFFAFQASANPDQAVPREIFTCVSADASLTIIENIANPDQVVIIFKKNEVAVYSHIHDLMFFEGEKNVWFMSEIFNKENSISIVSTTNSEAIASVKLLDINKNLQRYYGMRCQVNF